MKIRQFNIKKGRNLVLEGAPESQVLPASNPDKVAVLVHEFPHIKPKLAVAEGDKVKIGSPLFFDKLNPEIKFLSPGAGIVEAIERGDRRAILRIVIKLDAREANEKFKTTTPGKIKSLSRNNIVEQLLQGGLWPYLRQRPYNCIANPKDKPRSIFVNGMNTNPLAPDMNMVMLNQKDNFQAGMALLKNLTEGQVYLSIPEGSATNIAAFQVADATISEFRGAHPAGNSSVHIQTLERLRKGEIIWTINAAEVALMGSLVLEGKYPIQRTIALGGSSVLQPRHYLTRTGASVQAIVRDTIKEGAARYISGSVLNGFTNDAQGFISFYSPDLSVIPEGKERKFLGWMSPGFNHLSFSRSFLSALMPNKPRAANTNFNGSFRAIVATDFYDRYLPLEIYTIPLIKAILADDLERAEALGLLECVPEDFALGSFTCPSKIDVCGIVEKGLAAVKKEYA